MRVREIHPDFRGRGYTTRQMQSAPEGALFVWCNYDLTYPKMLARYLNRKDLIIKGPDIFNDGAIWLKGHNKPLILDHACELDHDEYQDYIEYLDWYERHK